MPFIIRRYLNLFNREAKKKERVLIKLHRDLLKAELGRLAYGPVATFSKDQLRYFFEAERLGKNSWRTLFADLPDGIATQDLLVVEHGDTVILVKKENVKEAVDKE